MKRVARFCFNLFILAAAVGLALTAAATRPAPAPASSTTPSLSAEEARQRKIAHTNIRVIQRALSTFRDVEAREPTSYKELCDSYYVPVRCSDIINPYLNRPVEDLADSPGDTHWEATDAGLVTAYYWRATGSLSLTKWSVNNDEMSLHTQEFLSGHYKTPIRNAIDLAKANALGAYSWHNMIAPLTPAEKAAFAVGRYLSSTIDDYFGDPGQRARFPKSIDDITTWTAGIDLNSSWDAANHLIPPVDRLRNEFTGGYAVAASTPSPGNFTYSYDPQSKALQLVVYGKNGEPIFQRYSNRPSFQGYMPPELKRQLEADLASGRLSVLP